MQYETARAQSEYQRLMAQTHTAFLQMAQHSFEQIATVLTGTSPMPAPRRELTSHAETPLFAPPTQLTAAPPAPYTNGSVSSNGAHPAHGHAHTPLFAIPAAPVASSAPTAPEGVAKAPGYPPTAKAAPVAPVAPQSLSSAPTVDLNQIMLEVVSDKTGYPTEMLELSMELEADLGIDSIKRVEILSAMQERVPTLPEVETSKMAALRTLAEVANALGAGDAPRATAGPATSATPATPKAVAPLCISPARPDGHHAGGGVRQNGLPHRDAGAVDGA